MKKTLFLILIFAAVFTVACQSIVTDVPTSAPAETGFKEISAAEAKPAVENKDAQFIDVRSDSEFAAEHAANTVNFPLDTLKNDLGKLDKSKPVYVICQTGRRSKEGAKILTEAGFSQVYSIEGGTNAWTAAGFPTEKNSGSSKGN